MEKSESKHKQLLLDFATLHSQYLSLQTLYDNLANDYNSLNRTFLVLNSTYFELLANFTTLNLQHSSLEDSYSKLSKNYTELETQFTSLNQSYSALQTQYDQLSILYSELQTSYATLDAAYNTLYEEYESLEKLLNAPLDDVVVPTWDEVEEWLVSDKTNEIPYDSEKFLCGDFSMMLIQHAKAMNWRMLFTVIEFDYYTENPLGVERHHGNHRHAFVSIFTTEGIIYIEPQSDYTWYLYYEGDPDTHVEFEDWEFIDFEDDWFGHIFVQYYNRMGMYVCPNEVTTGEIKISSNS